MRTSTRILFLLILFTSQTGDLFSQPNPTLSMIQFHGSRDSVVIRLRFHNNNVIWGCEGIQAAVGYDPQKMQPSLKPGRRWIHALKFASNNWLDYSNPFIEADGIDPDIAGYAEVAASGNISIGANQQFDLCKMSFEPQDQSTTTSFAYYGNTGASGQTGYLWIGDPDMRAFGSTSGLTAYYPVELLTFRAELQGDAIVLYWATAQEKNNQGFAVEKRFATHSPMDEQWAQIDFVKTRNGTTNSRTDYMTIDRLVHTTGVYEYRLKQIDHDGTFEYSPIVRVDVASQTTSFRLEQNYPNPFGAATTNQTSTSIRYSVPASAKTQRIRLTVYDLFGRVVERLVEEEKFPGEYSISFYAGDLPSGQYIYQMHTNGIMITKRMTYLR